MPKFLCIEDGEYFTVDAETLEDAQESASQWGAQAIRQLTFEEIESGEIQE